MSSPNFVVIHLSANAVRTCIGALSACKTKVELIAVGKSDTKSFRSGAIVHRENFVNAIKSSVEMAEKMANVRVQSAVICFSSPSLLGCNGGGEVIIGNDEAIGNNDMVAVLNNAKLSCVPPDSYIVQFFPQMMWLDNSSVAFEDVIGATKVHKLNASYHLMSLPAHALDGIYSVLGDCNIVVDDVIFDVVAGAEYALVNDEKERGVLYVNIGASMTSFCLYKQSVMLASGCIEMGGDEITLDLVAELSVSHSEAEHLKRHHARLVVADDSKKNFIDVHSQAEGGVISEYLLSEIVVARYDLLIDKVMSELDQKGLLGAFPAGVVLAGEGSQVKEIVPYLKRKLGVPVHLTNQNQRMDIHDSCKFQPYEAQVRQSLVEREFQMAFGALLCHTNEDMRYYQRIHTEQNDDGLFAKIGQFFDNFTKKLKKIA